VPKLSRPINRGVCNCTAMRKASRRVSQMYDAALASAGLKVTQLAILSEIDLRAHAPVTMRELADAMVMIGPRSVRISALSNEIGWWPGSQADADRRCKLVVLTEKGRVKNRCQPVLSWRVAQERFERT